MHIPNDPMNSNQDQQLADFTDRVLRGQVTRVESPSDDDLRALEETVLRLYQTLPNASLEQAAVKQMQVRLKARIRKEQAQGGFASWRSWFTPAYRRIGLSLALIALVLAVIFVPSSGSSNSTTTATALNPSINLAVALLLAGLLLTIFWITRRK